MFCELMFPNKYSEKHAQSLLKLIKNYKPTDSPIAAFPNPGTDSKPLLPDLAENSNKRTLVLDLDETLIHANGRLGSDDWINIRPGLNDFLKSLSARYELVCQSQKHKRDKVSLKIS